MSWLGRRLKRRKIPESICALPWVNLSLDVDGSSRPCCKFAHQDPESRYQLANLGDTPLAEVWNSPAMQQLRADFRAGARPAECSACWDEEAAGIPSFRQLWTTNRGIKRPIDFDTTTPAAPLALDLKLSNACNLKCRMCGPVASSVFLREELAMADADPGYGAEVRPPVEDLRASRRFFQANKLTQDPSNLETLRAWVHQIKDLEFTGGEPMLSAENREIIDLVVDEGHPERTTLVLTTNATVIDERITRHFPRFERVTVSLSIDDIDERIEYERAPLDWAQVQDNIAAYAAMVSPTVQVFLNCTVSTLNVWYLPEFVAWATERFPTGTLRLSNFNMVHSPPAYCIATLPQPLTESIARRLEANALQGQFAPEVEAQFRAVVTFLLGGRPDPDAWAEFVATTARRDAFRTESFARAFPDFHEELCRLGLWPAVGTVGTPVAAPGPRT